MIEDTPNKERVVITANRKRSYRYKNRSTLVLYFSNQSSFAKNYKVITDNTLTNMECQQASNVIVWVAKQNRYMVIKGFVTRYQLDIIELDIENLYRRRSNAIMMTFNRHLVLDYSHVPPEANYLND